MSGKYKSVSYKDFDPTKVKLFDKVTTLEGKVKKERINLKYDLNGEDINVRITFPRVQSRAGVKHKTDINDEPAFDANGDPQLAITYNFDLSFTEKDGKKIYNNPEHVELVEKLNKMSELVEKLITEPEAYPDFGAKLDTSNKRKPKVLADYQKKVTEEYRPIIFHVEDPDSGRVSDTTNANIGFYRPKNKKTNTVPPWGPRGAELNNFTRLSQPNEPYFPNQPVKNPNGTLVKDAKGNVKYTPNYVLLANKCLTHEPIVEFFDVYYDDKNGPRVRAKQVSTILIKAEAANKQDIQAEQREQLARDAHLLREAKQSDDILCQEVSAIDIKSDDNGTGEDNINPDNMLNE